MDSLITAAARATLEAHGDSARSSVKLVGRPSNSTFRWIRFPLWLGGMSRPASYVIETAGPDNCCMGCASASQSRSAPQRRSFLDQPGFSVRRSTIPSVAWADPPPPPRRPVTRKSTQQVAV